MSRSRLLFSVAVSKHKDPAVSPLPGVLPDAELLRDTLRDHADGDFRIAGWLKDSRATGRDILDGLEDLAKLASEKDQVLVYLGMHGHRRWDAVANQWRYFLLPYDATHETAETRGISAESLQQALGKVRARELVVILDCCYAGGLADIGWLGGIREDLHDGWRNYLVIATARGRDGVIDEDWGGLFIPAFCHALSGHGVRPGPDGYISAQQASDYAARVANAEAERKGCRQVAVSAGFAAPIPLTTVRGHGRGRSFRYVESYPRSQEKAFFDEVARLIPVSHRIRLVGTGLNVLWEQNIGNKLIEHAKRTGAEIDVCFGNPYNPSVQNRLIEEEMGGHAPPLGQRGIERLFKHYVERVEQLGPERSMRVWLFEHSPTVATLIFDDHVFHYPYMYRKLGTTSPVTARENDGVDEVARCCVENADLVIAESVSAEEVFRARREPRYVGKDWTAAAVFLVPEGHETLYQFGSGVLGRDIRGHKRVRTPVRGVRSFVGEAAEYGLHATLGDALYFATPAALERVKAELRFLAEHFPPFELTDFELAHPFHDDPAVIALRCSERGGVVEALHHEIVSRIYPLAISSNYRAGTTTKAVPDNPRSWFMLERYMSPHILADFRLHFTLCANYSAERDKGGSVLDGLRSELARRAISSVTIGELCLAVKRKNARFWEIDTMRFRLDDEKRPMRAPGTLSTTGSWRSRKRPRKGMKE